MGFLEDNTNLKNDAMDFLTPVNEFASGFKTGIKIFNDIDNNCDLKPVTEDLKNLFEYVHTITINSDFAKVITEILQRVGAISDKISTTSNDCKKFGDDIKKKVDQLKDYVSQDNFTYLLMFHLLPEYKTYLERANTASKSYKDGNWNQSGQLYGNLVYDAFLWKFQQVFTKVMLEISEKLNPQNALDFTLGFNKGFQLFSGLDNETECIQSNQQLITQINEAISIIKQIDFKDFGTAVQHILRLVGQGKKIMDTINSGTNECKTFASQVQRVYNELKDHVKSPIYVPSLAWHTFQNYKKIIQMVKDAKNVLDGNNFYEAGRAYGNLTNYAFFWDFKI